MVDCELVNRNAEQLFYSEKNGFLNTSIDLCTVYSTHLTWRLVSLFSVHIRALLIIPSSYECLYEKNCLDKVFYLVHATYSIEVKIAEKRLIYCYSTDGMTNALESKRQHWKWEEMCFFHLFQLSYKVTLASGSKKMWLELKDIVQVGDDIIFILFYFRMRRNSWIQFSRDICKLTLSTWSGNFFSPLPLGKQTFFFYWNA